MKLGDLMANPKSRRTAMLQVELTKSAWDDIADLIDAGFRVLEEEDEAYQNQLAGSWSSLEKQLEEQGYDWDPRERSRGEE